MPTPAPASPAFSERAVRKGLASPAPQSPFVPAAQGDASRADYHVGAVSPSTEQDLTFPEALARTQSSNHAAFKQIIEGVSHQLGLQGNTHSAVGDWEDGAEDSVLQTIPHPANPEVVKYAAAWYGLLGNQRAVLTFQPDPRGKDSFYQIDLKGQTDLGAVREQLAQAGVPFRTLVPGRRGVKVFVYDEGRQWRGRVAKFASTHNAVVRESAGQGSYLGAATRAAARAKYRAVITAYEAKHAPAGGGSLQAVREASLGHSGRGAANRAEAQGKLAAKGRRVRLSGVNAPAGGVIVRGLYYPGGHFIPSSHLEKATWDQYQTVEGRRAKQKLHRRGDGSYSLTPVASGPQKLAMHFHARDLIPTDPEPKEPQKPVERPSRTGGVQTARGYLRSRVEQPADAAKVAQAREAARSAPADPLGKLVSENGVMRHQNTSHWAKQRFGDTGAIPNKSLLPGNATPQQARQYISRLYNIARDFDSDVEAGQTGMTAYEVLLKKHALWDDILRAEAEYQRRGRRAAERESPLNPWNVEYHAQTHKYTPEEQRQIIQRHHDNRAIMELAQEGLLDLPEGVGPDQARLAHMHRTHMSGPELTGAPGNLIGLHDLSEPLLRGAGRPDHPMRQVSEDAYRRLGALVWNLHRGIAKPTQVDEIIDAIRDQGIPLNPERARQVWAEARARRTGEAQEP